jgi:hypothetical protein
MRSLHGFAVLARHQLQGRNEVVATAIALMGPANALFRKCTHVRVPLSLSSAFNVRTPVASLCAIVPTGREAS